MKLVSFETEGEWHIGAVVDDGDHLVDLTAAGVAADMTVLIGAGRDGLAAARAAVAKSSRRMSLRGLRIGAPIPHPRRNIFCVGKNYVAHATEFARSGFDHSSRAEELPECPIIFTKATTSVIGPGEPIPGRSDQTNSVDYEGELAVIIGAAGRNIAARDALAHVFGYTIVNDVTARTVQQRHKQWFLGKSFDGFCPMGPCLLTADAFGAPADTVLRTRVNGEERQRARISELIFDVPTLIETISFGTTLIPGDIIATGTPAGVGIGFKPPRYLRAGDVVSVEIDGIGILENPVI